jgi:OFA family oxalate/formate antiporter-like MFS transporter
LTQALATSAPAPATRWLAFASLSMIYFVIAAGAFSSLGVALPAMITEMKWDWGQAGLGYTVLGVACGLASVLPAVLIRRIGVRGTMAIGMATMIAGFATMALTHAFWSYLAATTLIGIAFSLVSTVPGSHVLTGAFKNRSTALGAYFAIGTLGSVAGPLIYVAVEKATGGWRPYWWCYVAMSVAAGLFAIATTPSIAKVARMRSWPPKRRSRPGHSREWRTGPCAARSRLRSSM